MGGFICVEISKLVQPDGNLTPAFTPLLRSLNARKTAVLSCLHVCCSSLLFAHTEKEVHAHPDLSDPAQNHERNPSPIVGLWNSLPLWAGLEWLSAGSEWLCDVIVSEAREPEQAHLIYLPHQNLHAMQHAVSQWSLLHVLLWMRNYWFVTTNDIWQSS